ncbi:hypothetical protein CRU79_15160 [Escherichia sp. E4385]|uniref:hypothetical protein n=1 Tax=Escherichia sp. E4385 TaxID=2040639 RepID=UPI00107F169D|nr:hypothetical protein [Escherichia sp. E4385]TGC14781.1 hypothetical protein CRU79_15160 [Escherichia sp. E4385]
MEKKRFETGIKNGIEKNKIQNNDIYILAERWPIGKINIQHSLNRVFDYYLNTPDQDTLNLVKIREIIDWHKKQDPFSELPENIKLQLTTLQNISDGNKEIVLQLSNSLSELYLSKEKKFSFRKTNCPYQSFPCYNRCYFFIHLPIYNNGLAIYKVTDR